jgi:2-oxoisovalerate dehydrogenase E2 component (dihydrolipoyl transacylase)
MSELKQFRLPDVGEGLTEAEIVAWHVNPGDPVKDGQIIIEIETAKAVVELPSPYDGTVVSLLVEPGQTVDVGAPIITVDTSAGSGSTPAAAEPEERHAVLVGYGVKTAATTRRPRKQSSDTNGAIGPVVGVGSEPESVARVLAKPPVRKLAKDLGVSLAGLRGSGPAGSVTRDDVQRAAGGISGGGSTGGGSTGGGSTGGGSTGGGSTRTASATSVSYDGERIPVRGVRKHMAAAMVSSAFTAPHVTEFLQVDVTETMAAVRRVRDLAEYEGVRVSPLLFVARALLVAVARHRLMNSSWDEAAQEIVVHGQVNLGIAVAAERGLIVPNVKDAGALPMPRLALALQELTETARAGKATPADLGGGTITITNVGVFGVDAGTPILTPGEVAILAFGQVKDAPWVVDGQLAVRKICTLSLSFDHRIVDGELGSAFLRDVGSMLEDPVRMLAWT